MLEEVREYIPNWIIDTLSLPNTNNFIATNVIGVHGLWSTCDDNFWPYLKNQLENKNVDLFLPNFPSWLNTNYREWESMFKEIDFFNYDTVIWHSLWNRYVMKYILDNKIKLKRLVLVSCRYRIWNNFLYNSIEENVLWLDELVDEIILIHSRNDEVIPFEEASLLKQNIPKLKLIEVDWYNHFNIEKEYDFLWSIVEYWISLDVSGKLQRILHS